MKYLGTKTKPIHMIMRVYNQKLKKNVYSNSRGLSQADNSFRQLGW